MADKICVIEGQIPIINGQGILINDSGSGGNLPIEISTDTEMEAIITAENVGKVYKFTGTTGTYVNGDLYIVEA